MKIATVVGARPQFIKAAALSRVFKKFLKLQEVLIHTGQHYDYNMSKVFFKDMEIPEPAYNLEIGSGLHGKQTGRMIEAIEEVLIKEMPNMLVVYGDTNSTLAGALAAAKINIPISHVEAGLRSYNRSMPEEHNRILTDHCSDLLFCPTATAVGNLNKEGIIDGVHLVGDTMYDVSIYYSSIALQQSSIMMKLSINPKDYILTTIHRPSNTDNAEALSSIVKAFTDLDIKVIFPLHPRTKKRIIENGLEDILYNCNNVQVIEPVGYLDMLVLEQNARIIITDSGGVQKEAYFFGVPCVTLRSETEWVETVNSGWNILIESSYERILDAVKKQNWPSGKPAPIYGDGNASNKIVDILLNLYF